MNINIKTSLNNNNNSNFATRYAVMVMQLINCFNGTDVHSNYRPPGKETEFNETIFCPKTYDGLLCWDPTPAGAIAYQNCPSHIDGWQASRMAFKKCTDVGEWFEHPETNKSWTNYTTCVDVDDLQFRIVVDILSICGNIVSIIMLTGAIITYLKYELLHCFRMKVHMNLFIALDMCSILWTIWFAVLIPNPDILSRNPAWCHVISLSNIYFTTSSYAWMFCESFYVYRSLVPAKPGEEYTFAFMIGGWVLPFFITALHYYVRWWLDDLDSCLVNFSYATYVNSIPVGISMAISLYYFVLVLRVIINKMRTDPGSDGIVAVSGPITDRFSRTARAATILIIIRFVLMFLFGLHYITMPMHPPLGTTAEKIYAVASSIITSYQGAILSLMFCYVNGDVRNRITTVNERKRRLRIDLNLISAAQSKKNKRFTGATAGESVPNVAETAV